mmetsp:Transcript_22237/g.30611  ORF Transcript_22237/g.30611 Transcript_22237/m.30611 type:complete len:120 (-) Transcript_22237:149-508(-)
MISISYIQNIRKTLKHRSIATPGFVKINIQPQDRQQKERTCSPLLPNTQCSKTLKKYVSFAQDTTLRVLIAKGDIDDALWLLEQPKLGVCSFSHLFINFPMTAKNSTKKNVEFTARTVT